MLDRSVIVATCVLLAGCDRLLGLTHVTDAPPGDDDAIVVSDTPVDADPCWNRAALTSDDDGDGHVDGCDNCPGDANKEQVDGDGDRVGDACDPRPNTPGDYLALFDSFAQKDPTWRARGIDHTWTHQPGVWRQTATMATTNTQLVYDKLFANPTVIVEFDGQVDPPATSTVGVFSLIAAETNPGDPPDGVLCGMSTNTDGTQRLIILELLLGAVRTYNTVPNSRISTPVGVTDPSRLSAGHTECTGAQGSGQPERIALPTVVPPATQTKIALSVYRSAARFTRITVIETR